MTEEEEKEIDEALKEINRLRISDVDSLLAKRPEALPKVLEAYSRAKDNRITSIVADSWILSLVMQTNPELKDKLLILLSRQDKTVEELRNAAAYVENTLADFTTETGAANVVSALYPQYINKNEFNEFDYFDAMFGMAKANLPADLLQKIYTDLESRKDYFLHIGAGGLCDLYRNLAGQKNLPEDLKEYAKNEITCQIFRGKIYDAARIHDWDKQKAKVREALTELEGISLSQEQIHEVLNIVANSEIHNAAACFAEYSRQLLRDYPSPETADTILEVAATSYLGGGGWWNKGKMSQLLGKILDKYPAKADTVEKIAVDNEFDDVLGHPAFTYSKAFEMLEEANAAVKSDNPDDLKRFKAKLAKMSEKEIFQIDHTAMEYLVNNFTQENFDKVNNLRGFWGLKAVISEESLTEKNLREIERMEFSHSVSVTEESNPHYRHTYSDAYKDFVPDYNEKYDPKDYAECLQESEAVQLLKEHGFESFTKQLPEVLSKQHVPPYLVPELCIKDLQHLLIDYHGVESRNGMYDFEDVGIEHKADAVRETFWKNVVANKKLLRFISNDLKKKGIPDSDIEALWENAEKYGNPNSRKSWNSVTSVFLQVHHRVALKDGGKNEADNFVIVVNIPGELNSHNPLHEYDNPLVHLYKHDEPLEDGRIISDTPQSYYDKEIRLNTVFVDDKENSPNRVLYYGGPRGSSRYIAQVHPKLRSALNRINKIYEKIARKKEQRNTKKNKKSSQKGKLPKTNTAYKGR